MMTLAVLLVVASLLVGCATATYEQQLRCARVGGTPNMFTSDLCVQSGPQLDPLFRSLQDSADYATGGANRGANGNSCYGCQGGHAPPSPVFTPPSLMPRPPITCQTIPLHPGHPEYGTTTQCF